MSRQTVNVNGTVYCADLSGALPGTLTIANATIGACVAPPPPGVDPDAIDYAQVIYGTDDIAHSVVNNVPMRQLANIFGRGSGAQPILPLPYHSGTIIQSIIQRGKHWRAAIDVPSDCVSFSRMLTAVSYSLPGHPLPNGWQQHVIRAAIVPRGADWSAATDPGSSRSGIPFADQLILQFGVGQLPSTARAELERASAYDLLLGFVDPNYGGGVVISLN